MHSDTAIRSDLYIAPNATVLGDVTLGDGVSVWFGAVVRGDRDSIAIGDNSNIQDNAVVHTSAGHPVQIGSFVSVGHSAILHGCRIHDRVLVGMGSIIMNGAVIGEDTLIGAGAVVTEGADIPAGSVVLGIPGKVARQTSDTQREQILHNAREYRKLAEKYRYG
ncbi:MAG: gamma carbonic anhydrase family protein [Methanomicrobiales archaeon]|nr:gamma carbonic anhydrase family protein [Methanomicrobiales archaeon]